MSFAARIQYVEDRSRHTPDHDVGNCSDVCCDDWRCPCEGAWLAQRGWTVSASDDDRIEGKARRVRDRAAAGDEMAEAASRAADSLGVNPRPSLRKYVAFHASFWPTCNCDYCYSRLQNARFSEQKEAK